MRTTERVQTWFANWRASRRRTDWDTGINRSDWDSGEISLLRVMARSQQMRHVSDDWNERPVQLDDVDRWFVKTLASLFLVGFVLAAVAFAILGTLQ